MPSFLTEKAKSAVLLALVEKSSLAIDCISEPATLFAGAKYKLAVLLVVAFELRIYTFVVVACELVKNTASEAELVKVNAPFIVVAPKVKAVALGI